jgi:hypothetical protein
MDERWADEKTSSSIFVTSTPNGWKSKGSIIAEEPWSPLRLDGSVREQREW